VEEFYSYFLEWGSMGAFAAYLVWNSIKQQKIEACIILSVTVGPLP